MEVIEEILKLRFAEVANGLGLEVSKDAPEWVYISGDLLEVFTRALIAHNERQIRLLETLETLTNRKHRKH